MHHRAFDDPRSIGADRRQDCRRSTYFFGSFGIEKESIRTHRTGCGRRATHSVDRIEDPRLRFIRILRRLEDASAHIANDQRVAKLASRPLGRANAGERTHE